VPAFKSLADALGITDPVTKEEPTDTDIGDLSARDFATRVLSSVQYRESVTRRIVMDDLPPAVECRLMDYAWGKPVERVEVEDKTPTTNTVPIDEIENRIAFLRNTIRLLIARGKQVKPEDVVDDESHAVH
jgi:hypothetical protein